MAELFSQILNMSLTGSIVIGVVLLVRSCIRKLPKIFSYALWSVVLFRLLCPVSISGPGSFLELLKPQVQDTTDTVSVVSYLPVPEDLPEFQFVPADEAEDQAVSVRKELSVMDIFSLLWIAGVCGMILYGAAQYLLLCKRLVGAIRYRGNIYLADHINTAFVMGVLFTRIYLPSHVPSHERKFILAHERHHIRRGDHVIKLLAYLALCIHWFNPLVWLAFLLAGKDMEMSCDEAVIRLFGSQIRAEYSASLLRLAAHRKPVPGMPLAFGEGDTKGRIMNMAKWKKPRLWASVLCGVLCIAVLAACAVNPQGDIQETIVLEITESSDPAYLETFHRENTGLVNIFLVILPEDEEAAKLGDSSLVLSLNERENALTIQSIPGEQVVDLPNYENHTTGNEPFRTCYALGYVWGGQAAAMEMSNACLQNAFGIHVDYNVEMTWGEVKNLIDSLGGVRVPLEENELAELSELDNPVLRNAQPGILLMDGDTAVAYAYPHKNEEDHVVVGGSRLRQRKLLAMVLSAVRDNPELAAELPTLYRAADPKGTPGEWSVVLDYLGAHTTFYLVGMESESQSEISGITGSDIITDTELVQYGDLNLLLPQGYASYARDNEVILTKDGTDIGGIRCYNVTDVPFAFSIEYLAAMGVPEALIVQKMEEPIAYIIGGNSGSGVVAEFFHEMKPETLNVEHNFYVSEGLIYDVYFDQNILNDVQASKFLNTIKLNDISMVPSQPEETDSLLLCRNVLENTQAAAYQIRVSRENLGDYALNRYSETVYSALREDWVSITHVPDDDSYHGYMDVNDTYYSNEGMAWDENGNVNWQEDPYPDEVCVPWIVSFRWNDDLVTYIDTILEDNRKTVMLRIDEPFRGYEDLTECYFVNMHFTEEGTFLNAKISLDFVWENDVSFVDITEAIVTLDETIVSTYIENEYTRAVSDS